MTETENLVLEQLRAIRADIADLREGYARIETRLTAIEHHMAGGICVSPSPACQSALLVRRTRAERRLELTEPGDGSPSVAL